jgi:hypothetical protein
MLEPSSITQAKQEPLRPSVFLALSTLFGFFLVAFLSVSSGIIASSDGVTIFNVTEALVERGEIAVKGDNVAEGVGGKLYSRYGIGLSLAAIPFYLLGKAMTLFSPAHLDPLVLKGAVSITNVAIGALACILLFLTALRLGYSQGIAFLLTVAFAFSTFFVVHATKSFLTQPLEALSMLGSIYHLVRSRNDGIPHRLFYAGLFAGVGILTKWFFVINLPILTAYLLITSVRGRRVRDLVFFSIPVGLAFASGLGYNYMRFGSVWQTGYAGTLSFSTPLLVGLYGLLLSSGKSLFLYAPVALLGVASLRPFAREHKREMWLLLGLLLVNLLAVSKHRDWSGEGAWGPRYLTLVLPCLILPIGSLIEGGSRTIKRGFIGLMLLGVLVQFGGLSVYYGTYYRIIGEFPYQREREDPLFLYKVRYIPNYSPVWGQFDMAVRNWKAFVRGEKPVFEIEARDERIPLSETDRNKLSETLDLWFAYAYYAGVPLGLCLTGMVGLTGSAVALGWVAARSCRPHTSAVAPSFPFQSQSRT